MVRRRVRTVCPRHWLSQHLLLNCVRLSLHADFYEINETKAITVGLPVNLTGHAQGVRDGGRLSLSIRKINVTAPYKQIPEKLDIDVTELQLGKAIKVGSLSFEGLEIATPKEVIVCSVKATRASRSAAAEAAE